MAVQVVITCLAANGPFVDEGLYTVAGLRVLEGHGLSDGYLTWFNGSPFAWPVLAAVGHRAAGLTGARLMAVLLSAITLVAFARTAHALFGPTAAAWGTAALALNGLFAALAHFAVYDVPALTGIAIAMWALTRFAATGRHAWLVAAATAFALAVVCKYAYVLLGLPLVGLLASLRGIKASGRPIAWFASIAGGLVAAYVALCFGSPMPTSVTAYLDQPFRRTREHIAALQIVFAIVPLILATAGAIVVWRRGRRLLVVTCFVALSLFPLFHLWTANFVSAQKHVVPGFLFAYALGGVALERMWRVRSRPAALAILATFATWGGVQWYWQEHSWSDARPLTDHLTQAMRPGDTVLAESSWIYVLALYPAGLIDSPAAVIDANYSPDLERLDVCAIPWLVGADTAPAIRRAAARCGHRLVLTSTSRHYYVDTSRLRGGDYEVVVGLYHRPR